MCQRLLLFFLCFLLLPAATVGGAQPVGSQKGPIKAMIGESLDFDIAFLWFDRLAAGRLTLSPGERPNLYRAVLEARTLGLAAWLTREREHHYVTLMELGADRRFRALSHESQVKTGQGENLQQRVKRYIFDEAAQQVRYQRLRDGKLSHDEVLPMADYGPALDILTVSYNVRAGVYGPLNPGAQFRIPTFNHKGMSYITIDVLTEKERRRQNFFPSKGGVVCRVQVDPEIFDTGNGILHIWLDEQGRPARSIVEKVIGIGTVKGVMQ